MPPKGLRALKITFWMLVMVLALSLFIWGNAVKFCAPPNVPLWCSMFGLDLAWVPAPILAVLAILGLFLFFHRIAQVAERQSDDEDK